MPTRRVPGVVDLSHPVDPSTPVFAGDPEVRFSPHATVGRDGFNLLRVEMGSHTGTHVDAPFHVRADLTRLDELDPALFVGPAVVVDVRHRGASDAVTVDDLTPSLSRLGPGAIVLLRTGWSARWGTASYFEHPYLGPAACRVLLDAGIRTIGLDTPSIDRTPDDALPCHHLVAAAGGVVVENLTHLADVGPDALVSVLPIRLTGADGAPVRAVAFTVR